MEKTYTIKDFLEVQSAGDASFSPDGSQVAYLSNRTGTSQIFLVATDGAEPEQITDFGDHISFVRFSPTQNVLLFGKAEGGNEQTQLYLLDLGDRSIVNVTNAPNTRHDVGSWSSDGKRICFASNERNGADFDVYVMDVVSLEKRRVFDQGEWCAAEGFSPLGTYVVVRQKHSNTDTDLYLCNLQTGSIEHITPHSGNVVFCNVLWLPDESAFLLIQDHDREFKGLARYTLASKSFEYVLTPDWDIESAVISKDGTTVSVVVNENGYEHAAVYDTRAFTVLPYHVPQGNTYRVRFSEDGSRLVFSLGGSRRTSDIWILNLETREPHQLTHSYQGVPPEAMVEPELIQYKSFDGLSISAFMYMPKNKHSSSRTPVVINIHGGPEAQYQPSYQPVMQYLVYSGYAVIAPNIRGSAGYGKTFLSLDDVEKRPDSIKDVVALREYIISRPDVNQAKIALYGASYGGYMVLACLAFYPKLWAAAVDIVGIANFVTFLENTAPYRRALREAEYGSLEKDRDLLQRISPIHAIEHIEAPLCIIHGANDPRVPLSEAEQVVARLKELGRHVELLVYPDEGHGISKLCNKLDAYPKIIDFLNKALL